MALASILPFRTVIRLFERSDGDSLRPLTLADRPLVIILRIEFRQSSTVLPSSYCSALTMTALDLSADAGLIAILLVTSNICLGLLIAVRYSPRRLWPHRQFNIFAVHQWTAYLLLASIAVHIVLLFFLPRPHWRAVDVFVPLHSPVQPVENTIGAASVYLVVVVVLTSYFRLQLGRRRWKLFHFLVYAAAIGIFSHGLLANPQLTNAPIDPLDGEKLLVEFCFLVVTFMTAWAWRMPGVRVWGWRFGQRMPPPAPPLARWAQDMCRK